MADLIYLMAFVGEQPVEGKSELDYNHHHITILGPVGLPTKNYANWVKYIKKICLWHKPIYVEFDDKKLLFGSQLDIPVNLVSTGSHSLQELHSDIVDSLTAQGGKSSATGSPDYPYIPHITNYSSGEPFFVKEFVLVAHSGGFGVDIIVREKFSLT